MVFIWYFFYLHVTPHLSNYFPHSLSDVHEQFLVWNKMQNYFDEGRGGITITVLGDAVPLLKASMLNISVKDCSSCKCYKFKIEFTAVGWQVKRSLQITFALSCPSHPDTQCTQVVRTETVPSLGNPWTRDLGEVPGDRRAVCWMCLRMLLVIPDGLRRFASSRNLGLGLSHVREGCCRGHWVT